MVRKKSLLQSRADRLAHDQLARYAASIPLKPLHSETSLSPAKLAALASLPTEVIIESLQPGTMHALKAKADGTIMDGHHRLRVLRERGVDINQLPREIV